MIEEFIIEKLDSYRYLVFGGILPSHINPTEILSLLNQLTKEYTLLGAQLFDYRLIWGYRHIHSAIWHAAKADKAGSMISKSLPMEFMIFAAGCRQIKKAIELIGIQEDTYKIIGILLASKESLLSESYSSVKKKLKFQSDLTVIDNYSEKKEVVVKHLKNEGYNISSQISDQDIEKIFLQKVALLTLEA
ncbi:MAG: KEOPS complex subunit Cgi121 [Candidatus Hodarchaeales archaeon]